MSAPIQKEIFVVQGEDFVGLWRTVSPRAVVQDDLSGYSLTGSFKRNLTASESYPLDVTLQDEESSTVRVSFNGETTLALKPGRYFFDVLASGGNLPRRVLFQGLLYIDAAISTPPEPG